MNHHPSSLPSNTPKPPTKHPIHLPTIHLPPNPLLLAPPSIPHHLPHLPLSPLPLPRQHLLHHPPHLLLLLLLLIRLPIPPLLQLRTTRLLEASLRRWVFFQGPEDVGVGGKECGSESLGCELEDEDGEEDDEQAKPPVQRAPEGVDEGAADKVDGLVGVGEGEDEVPEEPAADGEEDCDAVCDCFRVRLDEPVLLVSQMLYL